MRANFSLAADLSVTVTDPNWEVSMKKTVYDDGWTHIFNIDRPTGGEWIYAIQGDDVSYLLPTAEKKNWMYFCVMFGFDSHTKPHNSLTTVQQAIFSYDSLLPIIGVLSKTSSYTFTNSS